MDIYIKFLAKFIYNKVRKPLIANTLLTDMPNMVKQCTMPMLQISLITLKNSNTLLFYQKIFLLLKCMDINNP